MEFTKRRDQFSFFIGYASRNKKKLIERAVSEYDELNYAPINPQQVFSVAPFNDNIEQIIRSYHIYENRESDIVPRLLDMMGEFIFPISDFEPPCCQDGRAIYCHTCEGKLLMECDRCGVVYDLEGRVAKSVQFRRMMVANFITYWGNSTFNEWPYHKKLANLPRLN